MGKPLIIIKGDIVTIADNGKRLITSISDWGNLTKEQILQKYMSDRIDKGGENTDEE